MIKGLKKGKKNTASDHFIVREQDININLETVKEKRKERI